MMIRRLWIVALSLMMVVVIAACGSSSEETVSNDESAAQNESEMQTLSINIGGTAYLVDAPEPWQELGSTIGNLSVTLQPITTQSAENVEDTIATLGRMDVGDLYTTTLNGQTIYIGDGSSTMDLFVVYNESELFILNITTIGDAEVATYQEEIAQIMSTLRPE